MSISYETESMAVISCLEQGGYSSGTLAEHRRCYDAFGKYLSETGNRYSMEAVLNWLESRKATWSFYTYKLYWGRGSGGSGSERTP